MKPKPTNSQDVALAAGVSRATVSYVLNGRTDQSIPEETRRRVERAARDLAYRPNRLARSLQRGKTQTLGVMMPSLCQSFHAAIMQGVREVCFEQDYRILMAQPEHEAADGDHVIRLMLEHQVDGLLCVAAEAPENREQMRHVLFAGLEQALAAHLSCVVVDDRSRADRVDCVATDDVQGARGAVEHLLGLGHRRIGHLSGGEAFTTARDRCLGYRQALASARVPVEEALISGVSFQEEDAADAMASLLSLSEPPTAVFAANDYLAAVGQQVAHSLGLLVPDDLALVGYGDIEMARFLGLTTVQQHPRRIGRAAAERLLERLRHPETAPQALIQPTDLVIRASCGKTFVV